MWIWKFQHSSSKFNLRHFVLKVTIFSLFFREEYLVLSRPLREIFESVTSLWLGPPLKNGSVVPAKKNIENALQIRVYYLQKNTVQYLQTFEYEI